MADIAVLQLALQWFTLSAYVALLLKIYFEPALHRYRCFAIYLGAMATRSLLTLIVPQHTTAYGWVFILSAPIIWVCYVLVIVELYSLVLGSYKGIATFGRYAVAVGMGISVLISGGTLLFDASGRAEQFPVLLAVFMAERWIVSSLLLMLLMITAFLLWFPVVLTRNVVVYSLVYFVYFLSKALALFFRNTIGPSATNAASVAIMCTGALCLVTWIIFLNREGEREYVKRRFQWSSEEEHRLLSQLDAINATLQRSARK